MTLPVRLPHVVIRIGGPDCEDFLNRILTSAVKTLPVGTGHPSALLGSDGRLVAEILLFRTADNFFVTAPPSEDKPIYSAIDRFLFTEQVDLEDVSANWCVVHHTTAGFSTSVIATFSHGTGVHELLPIQDATCARDADDGYRAYRTWLGQPTFGIDYDYSANPLEVGLKCAVSFTKGCFPGQEIMARIENLGHPAKYCVVVNGTGQAPNAGPLTGQKGSERVEIGRLTSAVERDGHWRGIATVKHDWRLPLTNVYASNNAGVVDHICEQYVS